MGHLSKEAVQRLYVMTLVGRFPKGAFGAIRLQKTSYHAARESGLAPFLVEFHHHGQFSHQLAETLEQLLAMNYVGAAPLGQRDENDGNRYWIRDRMAYVRCRRALALALPELERAIDQSVEEYGMLPQRELLRRSYEFLEGVDRGEVVLDENLPTQVEVSSLSDEECDELEMALSPAFIQNVKSLALALETAIPDMSQVRHVGELSASGS